MFFLRIIKGHQIPKLTRHFDHLRQTSSSASSSSSSSSSPSSASSNAAVMPRTGNSPIIREIYGQPTSLTHPHLLNADELVPGLRVQEFQNRRIRLATSIEKYASEHFHDQKTKNHMIIIPSTTKKYMSDKIPYFFRQNTDFFYLTGCLEPDTVLVLNINEQNNIKSTLFMRPKDKHAELWDGPRTGVGNAVDMFGVDEAYPCNQLQKELQQRYRSDKPFIWYDDQLSNQPHITEELKKIIGGTTLRSTPTEFVQSMRLYKSPAEQELMRKTCQIASKAINEVMLESRPGLSEHHIYAMIDYKCRMNNASYLAYPPVVASGNNATTIHYINNTQLTRSGEMVLVDAGCEYGGYTSDITRTWPVDGTFTAPQRVIYDVVLTLQKELIDMMMKDINTLDKLFDTMCIKLGKYLQEAGLVAKDIDDETGFMRAGYKFCPHHVSHYLGMDVHDTPLIPRNLPLQPGMVCTVEPGIYIGTDRADVPKEFRGLGVRIEDDVLITPDCKVEVLTSSCLKERSHLENLFKIKC